MENKPDKDNEVIKNAEIIAYTPTKYFMHNLLNEAHFYIPAFEYKLLLITMGFIKETDNSLKRYTISFKKLASIIGMRLDNFTQSILPISKTLIKRSLEIYNKVKDEWDLFSWVSHINVNKKDKLFTIQLNSNIQEYIIGLKLEHGNFTAGLIPNIMYMRGIYATRFYNFCIQYQNLVDKKSKVIKFKKTIQEIKAIFQVQSFKTYNRLDSFKKKILDKAQSEILKGYNANFLDMYFTYENIKEGSKVIAFWFIIHKRIPKEIELKIKDTKYNAKLKKQADKGLKLHSDFFKDRQRQALEIYFEYTPEQKASLQKEISINEADLYYFDKTNKKSIENYIRKKENLGLSDSDFITWAEGKNMHVYKEIVYGEEVWITVPIEEKKLEKEAEYDAIEDVPVDF